MQLTGNKILITGGATGIGSGFATRFLEEGNTVILCGRRAEKLQAFQNRYPQVLARVCDLSIEQERTALSEWLHQDHQDLNVLLNNAGIQHWMHPDEEGFMSKASEEITINILAPLHLTHLLRDMPALKTVLNVTSGLSFNPLIKVPVYSATKAFMHSYTLSLRALWEAQGKEVIEVIPPALNTDLGAPGLHDFAPPVSDFIAAVFEQLKEGKTELTFGMSAAMAEKSNAAFQEAFERMNGLSKT